MEMITLTGQFVLVGLLAGWIGLGALENIRAPWVNREAVADVLSMRVMRNQWPRIYSEFRRNRIAGRKLHAMIFLLIVVAETAAALALGVGAAALCGALFGWVAIETARILATAGVIGFVAVWGAFLVGGQWVHYWIAHKDSQHTHFMLTIWGVGTYLALI